MGGGHFAKMVHNGIEYGMMQAFGEGFATMVKSDLVEDPAAVMSSWKDGSVVQSWLLDLLAIAFKSDPTLQSMPPVANESGEATSPRLTKLPRTDCVMVGERHVPRADQHLVS